jgi:hypothetical protein
MEVEEAQSADKRTKREDGENLFNSNGKQREKRDDGRSEDERYYQAEKMLTEEAPWRMIADPPLSLTYMLRR